VRCVNVVKYIFDIQSLTKNTMSNKFYYAQLYITEIRTASLLIGPIIQQIVRYINLHSFITKKDGKGDSR